jgi:hypothetical protein
MNNEIEILVGDVNDVEAQVYARYRGPDAEHTDLRGILRGPFCETSRTLPAEFSFRDTGQVGEALALVPDPCTWSPELPHVYQVDVEARAGDRVVAEYHGTIGVLKAK